MLCAVFKLHVFLFFFFGLRGLGRLAYSKSELGSEISQTLGTTLWMGDCPVARSLTNTEQHVQRINADMRPCPEWDSNLRSQYSLCPCDWSCVRSKFVLTIMDVNVMIPFICVLYKQEGKLCLY
jgi:hypothetical protein